MNGPLSDGIVLFVDASEGVMLNTERLIKHAVQAQWSKIQNLKSQLEIQLFQSIYKAYFNTKFDNLVI